MAVIYDPLTGLPKQQQPSLNTPYGGTPLFSGQTSNATAPNTTGVTANTTAGAPSGQNPYSALNDDPLFRQLQADLAAHGVSDLAGAQAAARRGVVLFGEVPNFDETLLPPSWIDETTRQLAAQNTAAGTSAIARSMKTNKDNIKDWKNILRQRGALRSSELGRGLGEEDLRYRNEQFDMRQQLTDYFAGLQAALAAAERGRAGQRAAGAESAAGRVPAPAAPAPPPASVNPPPAGTPPDWMWPSLGPFPPPPPEDPYVYGVGGAKGR